MNDDEDRRIKAGTIVRTADPGVARTACRSSSALLRSTTVTPRFVGVWNASTSYGIDNLNRFTGREIAGASNTKANRSTGDAGVWSSDTISPWSAAWSPKWYCLQVLFERERWAARRLPQSAAHAPSKPSQRICLPLQSPLSSPYRLRFTVRDRVPTQTHFTQSLDTAGHRDQSGCNR